MSCEVHPARRRSAIATPSAPDVTTAVPVAPCSMSTIPFEDFSTPATHSRNDASQLCQRQHQHAGDADHHAPCTGDDAYAPIAMPGAHRAYLPYMVKVTPSVKASTFGASCELFTVARVARRRLRNGLCGTICGTSRPGTEMGHRRRPRHAGRDDRRI